MLRYRVSWPVRIFISELLIAFMGGLWTGRDVMTDAYEESNLFNQLFASLVENYSVGCGSEVDRDRQWTPPFRVRARTPDDALQYLRNRNQKCGIVAVFPTPLTVLAHAIFVAN